MPLIDPIPKPLEEKLAPVIESKDVVAAVFTDLDPSGRFGEEWLVLTPTRLSVYVSNGNGFAPRVELNLEEIKTASADLIRSTISIVDIPKENSILPSTAALWLFATRRDYTRR